MVKRPRTALRLLLVVVLALTLLSCHSERSAEQAPIGMLLHFRGEDDASIERQFDLMTAMGVTWVRIDFDWAVIERIRGQHDWDQTDKFVHEAVARKMNVLGVVAFTPEWARPFVPVRADRLRHLRPDDLTEYANFARLVAERYAHRGVRTWEIWNEPNIPHFWPPSPDADDYGELFRVGAQEIRETDRRATVLIGGLSPRYDDTQSEISPITYLEHLYTNGTAHLADGIAAHPYTFPGWPMDGEQRTEGGFNQLPELRAVMVRHGDSDKKLWITEFGAPTGTGTHAVSEDEQAAMLLQARQQVRRWDWAGPLIYYELVDGGTDPTDIAENFGVLRKDLSPKPAAVALMNQAGRR